MNEVPTAAAPTAPTAVEEAPLAPPVIIEYGSKRALITAAQWKSGIAAWLGWLFDGLDMHLYLLFATPFVAQLLPTTTDNPDVGRKTAWIQGAFLVGWALGGGF